MPCLAPPSPQIFQGTFTARGYRLGRLAAMLYRLQDSHNLAKDATIKPGG
jgi:hypothetical protein